MLNHPVTLRWNYALKSVTGLCPFKEIICKAKIASSFTLFYSDVAFNIFFSHIATVSGGGRELNAHV